MTKTQELDGLIDDLSIQKIVKFSKKIPDR